LIEFSKTANGFDIAKLDLKYRDSGDILDGTIQSGQKFKWLNLAEDEEVIKEAKKRVFGGENEEFNTIFSSS
jgi:ATP-dependent DNA helicase RecG